MVQGSTTVFVEGIPAARVGDFVSCPLTCGATGPPHTGGAILTGSTSVFIDGLPAARVGSLVAESCATSTIIVGANSVDIGG